jgi:hypothetical protein
MRTTETLRSHLNKPIAWRIIALAALAIQPGTLPAQTVPRNRSRVASPVHASQQRGQGGLKCSTAPCVLPNAQVSIDQANTTIVTVNPEKSHDLLSAALDYQCGAVGAQAYGSDDGGLSWHQSCNGIGGNLYSVPTLAYGLGGTAYIAGFDGYASEVFLEATQDNGQTWGKAVTAVKPLFVGGYPFTPWLTVDNGQSSSYKGRLYVVATQVDNAQVQSQVTVSYSPDGGNTWVVSTVDNVQVKPELDYYTRVAVGKDGTVFVTWQRCEMTGQHINCGGTNAHMLFSKSSDGGNTWSSSVEIASVRLAPDSCQCAFFGNLPRTIAPVANPPLLAVDNSQGRYSGSLYVVVYDWKGQQMKVEVVTSRDGGQSWRSPVEVGAAYRNDQFFPGISVGAGGVVGVSWLDRRNDDQDILYQPFAAISKDGGKSFGRNYRLAPSLSDPFYAYGYMGDYTGNAWAGRILYAAWPDTRNSIMQDYVGGLFVK